MRVPTVDAITHPLAAGYDCRINNTLWQLAPTAGEPVDIQPVRETGQVVQSQENPEDFGVSADERSFSRESFVGGEGLARAQRRDANPDDYTRFWSSEGLEAEPALPGEPERLRLAPAPDTLDEHPAATSLALASIDAVLFCARDSVATVARYDTPTVAGSTPTEETVAAGATSIIALTRIGRQLYACSSAQGIYQRSSAGTWTSFWASFDADRLWGAKLRLLGRSAANPHQLHEITGTGTTQIVALPAGSVWHDLDDSGEYILAAGSDGFIYAIGETGGTLVLSAQTEMEGEEPVSIAVAQGVVFIGTRQATTSGGYIGRLWRAEMNGPRIVNGQVLRTWGDTDTAEDWSPYTITTNRDTAVVWARERLWHYHLQTSGLHSWMEAPNGPAASHDLLYLGGVVFGAVVYEGAFDPGIFFQTTKAGAEGYLITPAIDFFTTRAKDWVGLSLFHGKLSSSQQLQLWYSTDPAAMIDPDHGSWILALSRNGPTSRVDEELPLRGVRSRWLVVKLVVKSGPALDSPAVFGLSVRAQPVNPDVMVLLPINISDWVDSPWRSRRVAPGLGKLRQATLFGFRSSSVEVELYRRGATVRGRVMELSEPETVTTPGGASTLRAVVSVKGQLVGVVGQNLTLTGDTYGVPLYGESLFGGG